MKLPDLSMFFLVPEFWHTGYILLKHVALGPPLEKGASEEDGKRFGWRNFVRPLLVIMRRRGRILDKNLIGWLQMFGQEIPENAKQMSWAKEKMGAEFKDLHLYLTYLLSGFNQVVISNIIIYYFRIHHRYYIITLFDLTYVKMCVMTVEDQATR